MQALGKLALEPIAESTADQHSYGFRPFRGAHDAIQMAFNRFSNQSRPMWVLEADIDKFYDKISHEWILKNIPMDKVILCNWLSAGHFENGSTWTDNVGVPQGGFIPPTIANMTLDGLQEAVQKVVSPYILLEPNAKMVGPQPKSLLFDTLTTSWCPELQKRSWKIKYGQQSKPSYKIEGCHCPLQRPS